MRQSEIRTQLKQMSDAELLTKLGEERKTLYAMRQQIALKQLDNPHAITAARKNIARILCEMTARKNS